MTSPVRTLLVDNHDSYTFNLFQLLAQVNGVEPLVVHHDGPDWATLRDGQFDNVVISPGPGHPGRRADFGICADLLADTDRPVLGVCLGHQGIALADGARIGPAPTVAHGRISRIRHTGTGLFAGLPQGFAAVRYHSLAVAEPLPPGLEPLAWSEDGVLMGLRDRRRPRWGVQFHPESVCTEQGAALLANFRALTQAWTAGRPAVTLRPSRAETVLPAARPEPPPARHRVYSRELAWRDPEQVFVQLFARQEVACWLDSSRAEPGLARFSYQATTGGPLARLIRYDVRRRLVTVDRAGQREEHPETVFDYLERELGNHRVHPPELPFGLPGGFVGYLGYELRADCGSPVRHASDLPDAALLLADRILAYDHLEQRLYLVAVDVDTAEGERRAEHWLARTEQALTALTPLAQSVPSVPSGPVRPADEPVGTRLRPGYLADVAACQRFLAAGESYELCLTDEIRVDYPGDPLTLHRVLRRTNPAPYAAYLRFPGLAVVSSSPERFFRLERDGSAQAKPIKGTAPRAVEPAADAALAESLRTSAKTRAENLMIVDLLRNDLGQVCEVGSVRVDPLMAVESYRNVHQLVSTVHGTLRKGLGPVDWLRAGFPAGSMTGAPKVRTMELLDRLEDRARGVYAGALGYLGLDASADLSVVIRTAVVAGGQARIGVGGAVVDQSVPEAECAEALLKAEPLLRAVERAAALD